MFVLDRLTKRFETGDVETTALNEIGMAVSKGDFVAVMGPSGCGKSTLLNILGMLDSPTSGSYFFDGEDIANYSEHKLTLLRKKYLGFVFQSFNLIDQLSVEENVGLPLQYLGVSRSEREERILEVLKKVTISHRAKHRPNQLSGGQRQRVAVARALINEPKLILADEPTGNLDTKNGEEVMNMLCDLNRDGATIIMVTHSEEHANYAGRVIRMLDGAIRVEK